MKKKTFSISLQLNFTPNTLGCYRLILLRALLTTICLLDVSGWSIDKVIIARGISLKITKVPCFTTYLKHVWDYLKQ